MGGRTAHMQQQYARWEKAHINLKNTPVAEGTSYIRHAVNLLTILEPIAELHPIAKAVVGCFKQVVLFEQDRQENDVRVVTVILAQTDMMRVLLDLDGLVKNDNSSHLRSLLDLPALFGEIAENIRASHNSIDTYYKEHRLVKLYRAREWKDRMLGYIQSFDAYRVRLHQTLSLKVASGVNDLVSKMDTVLSRLFVPKEKWELEVTQRLQAVRNDKQWMMDSKILHDLVAATGDTSMTLESTHDPMLQAKVDIQLGELKEDMQLSLDVLCDKNMDLFSLKLMLHTERLEQAITMSARMVIRTLSGPYDRLENADLRNLWKEMNWFFCIETKIFSLAIFEYYLDLYSTPFREAPTTEEPSKPALKSYMPKHNVVGQFKSGLLNHPEAWTLNYLLLFSSKVAPLIDMDGSGYIRISEANNFTSQIPEGWTLPQWCAYLVQGQFHENSLYRHRIMYMRGVASELSANVLKNNQYGSMSMTLCIDSYLHFIVLEPRTTSAALPVVPELHELVKQKMLDQDARLRAKLGIIKWAIRDESTIQVLFGNRPLEEWVLPYCCVMMELVLDIHQAGASVIMDFKEWLVAGYLPYASLEKITTRHVQDLEEGFQANPDSTGDIRTYHGGIWSLIELTYSNDYDDNATDVELMTAPLTRADVESYYSNMSFRHEFPLPIFTGSLLSRKYTSWEEHIKDKDPSEIPSSIPFTWNPIDDKINTNPLIQSFMDLVTELPLSGWFCDKCSRTATKEKRYHCAVCPDMDLCDTCYKLPVEEHTFDKHSFSHLMLLETVFCQALRHAWVRFRGEIFVDSLREEMKEQSLIAHTEDGLQGASEEWKSGRVCAVCASPIICGSATAYHCVEISCEDFSLCSNCCEVREFPEGSPHFWWHTLVPFDMRIIKHVQPSAAHAQAARTEPDPEIETQPVPDTTATMDQKAEIETMHAFNDDVERRFADVVHSVTALESKIVSLQTVIREPPALRVSDGTSVIAVDDVGASAEGIAEDTSKPIPLPTPDQAVDHTGQRSVNEEPVAPVQRNVEDGISFLETKINGIESKMNGIESKMNGMESKMNERMSGIESKMDELLKGMSSLLASK